MTKRMVRGRAYNTKTATEIVRGALMDSFGPVDVVLYARPGGGFFYTAQREDALTLHVVSDSHVMALVRRIDPTGNSVSLLESAGSDLIRYTLRIPASVYAALEALSKKHDSSINHLITNALRSYIANKQ